MKHVVTSFESYLIEEQKKNNTQHRKENGRSVF